VEEIYQWIVGANDTLLEDLKTTVNLTKSFPETMPQDNNEERSKNDASLKKVSEKEI
jgi:hypothetical protein